MDTYLNIGSIENFREYYTTYAEVAIGEYEHWEEEEWVDAANPDWQKFIGQLSQELNEKGVDGFFINRWVAPFDSVKTMKSKVCLTDKRAGTLAMPEFLFFYLSLSRNPVCTQEQTGSRTYMSEKTAKRNEDNRSLHFHVANFFKFMATNLSFTQFVT